MAVNVFLLLLLLLPVCIRIYFHFYIYVFVSFLVVPASQLTVYDLNYFMGEGEGGLDHLCSICCTSKIIWHTTYPHSKKKVNDFPFPNRDVTNLGTGKSVIFFYSV
jgi:hypothetical protein